MSSPAPTPDSILASLTDPGLFLHRLDPVGGQITLVHAAADALRDTVFLDGRTTFWRGEPVSVSLDDALAVAGSVPVSEPDRYIFHVSFCGSTLLAGLLEVEMALVLKEPHALVDLADWEVGSRRSGACGEGLDATLALTCDLLKRPRQVDRPVVVKPSNWVNALLPRLVEQRPTMRPLFLTMEREAFLIAVFRGGRDRLAFIARIAALLATVVPDGQNRLRSAEAGATEPLGQVANLVVLAHAFQIELFDRAMTAGGWGDDHRLDFATLMADPAAALRQVCSALDLATSDAATARAVTSRLGTNAKQPNLSFSTEQRAGEDAEVCAVHGATLDAALDWARRTIDCA